jgi:AcrR family transcriptional regulator
MLLCSDFVCRLDAIADNAFRYYTAAVASVGTTPRRKDAQRNRDAILGAARALFADSGDVPMYEVARRAGVGQATLYRNFPDRADLAAALLAEQLEIQERVAAEHAGDPDAFFMLLRSVAETVACCHALGDLAQEQDCAGSQLERHRQRLAELMQRPLRDAKAAGTIRRDLTIDDVFLMVAMVKGAVGHADGSAARATAASRALTLVLEGVAPSRG